MANLKVPSASGVVANNTPVGAAGQPNKMGAMKKAIAARMSRNQKREKGQL